MKCLVIGGGRFLGHKVVEELANAMHDVAFLDPTPPPRELAGRVTHILGEKSALGFYAQEIDNFAPESVTHLSLNTAEETRQFVEFFAQRPAQLVVTSNCNVYLAQARFRQTERGPSLSVPIGEGDPLREKPLKDDETAGDKRDVERALAASRSPTTILRLTPLYGPEDYLRRFYPLMVRMIDGRPHILLGSSQADWRWTHAFVGDAAAAIALAAATLSPHSRVYNVGEVKTPTVRERISHIATVFGWEGKIGVIEDALLPDYMQTPGDFSQDLVFDTSKIRRELGFKEAGDYYDGLAASVEWYRANPPAHLAGKLFNYAAEDALSFSAFNT